MRSKERIDRRHLLDLLTLHGLSITRTAFSGKKSWTLSNGETYTSLQEVYDTYKNKPLNNEEGIYKCI